MTFATSKFKSFLPAATFAMAAEFLMRLTDSVVCGHILGEPGLSAVNLMQGVFEIVAFTGMVVTVGTSVIFATELGAMHVRRARGYFTLGFASAVVLGLACAAALAAARMPVIRALGASPAVSGMAAAFWLWYLPAAALKPVAFFLGTMCCADGDARLSFLACAAQLAGNLLSSVPLTIRFGAAGCALGTGLGFLAATVVLLFHFRKPGCMLGFSRHFVLSDFMRIAGTSIGDAGKDICEAALMFALNAYVIARFGSDALPVLAVAVMAIGISEIFDGVANAAQPLASVHIGERNPLLARRVMRSALATVMAEGVGAMLLLLAFPGLMLLLAGIDSPETASEARVAVRLVAVAHPGLALVLLFNSHYVFIGKEWLSAALTMLAGLFVPLALFPAFGAVWGARGVWAALGVAPILAVASVAALVLAIGGRRRFPFLLQSGREAALRVFDLELTPDAVCRTSAEIGELLQREGIDGSRAAKAALLVEEALMVVRDRNAGRRTLAEVTVDLNDGLTLVLRDDGEIFDITDADSRVSSLRSYLVSNLMTALPVRRNLTATGFNRNVFKL